MACARPTSCSTACGPMRPRSCGRPPRSRWRPISTSSPKRAAYPKGSAGRSSQAGVDVGGHDARVRVLLVVVRVAELHGLAVRSVTKLEVVGLLADDADQV